jgi:Flp pilus assembly protein TadG
MMKYKAKGRDRRRRGIALVEAAIVLTILLMVTIGTLEYGWMFVNLQRITNAARQGARVASVSGAADTDGEAHMTNILGSIPVVSSDVQFSVNADGEDIVTATVVVNTSAVGLVNWDLLPMPEQLQAVVTMAREP